MVVSDRLSSRHINPKWNIGLGVGLYIDKIAGSKKKQSPRNGQRQIEMR